MIRVLIADDHPLMLCGIRETLHTAEDIMLVGEATHGDDVRRLCRDLLPDVLLLDLQMPGPTAIQIIADLPPTVRVIILTAYDDDVYVRSMLAAKVAGYVLKDEVAEVVITATHTVSQGGIWLSRRVLERLMPGRSGPSDRLALPPLTNRQRQLLHLLARGWDTQQIAVALNLGEQTVRNYLSRLYAEIGVHSRTEALIWAWEHGIGGDSQGWKAR